jgi:heptosyltransferase-3
MSPAIDFSSIHRILVCKLRHHGDVLLCSPVFSVLKKAAPHAQIDAYIYSETLPMLQGHPAISEFMLYEKGWKKLPLYKRAFHEIKLLLSMRKKKYDLVINLTEGDRGAIVSFISGAPYRVAFDPRGRGMFGKKWCYTHLVHECPMMRHTVETNLDLLRGIGLFPNEEERGLFFQVAENFVLPKQPYVVVHPVSRWMFKCTSEKLMAEIIDEIHARGLLVVLTSSQDKEEMAYNAKVKELTQAPILDLSGKISLKELGSLIKGSELLVCVDSVPMHIASALKSKVIAIFGPTSEVRWAPWQNPNAKVVFKQMPCRPCYRKGCVDCGKSDCLLTLDANYILKCWPK